VGEKGKEEEGTKELRVEIQDGQLRSKLLDVKTGEETEGPDPDAVDYSYFYCGYELPGRGQQVVTMSLLALMFLMGVFIMINGMIQVVDMINAS
jgi:hypothetical protein